MFFGCVITTLSGFDYNMMGEKVFIRAIIVPYSNLMKYVVAYTLFTERHWN